MRGCFRHFTEKYRQTENQEQTASHESQCRTRVLTRVTDNIGVVAPSLLAAADIRGLILGLYDSGLTTQQLAKTALDLELLPTEKSALATQVIAHVLPDYKDGYTDLRGRFDYASLNTNELENAARLAVLVISDRFGAVVREAAPPKR